VAVVIVCNNIGARLAFADPDARSIIADTLSFDVDDAAYSVGFQVGSWNGKRTFLRENDSFETGFLGMVTRALSEKGIPYHIQDNRPIIPSQQQPIDLIGIEALYDFQAQVPPIIERDGRGVVRIPTGGGKTEVAAAIIKRLGVKTLFMTHKLDLVEQARDRLNLRLGRPVGVISEGEWLPADITVASVQTIIANWSPWWRVTGVNALNKKMEKTVRATNPIEACAVARGLGMKFPAGDISDSVTLLRDNTLEVGNFLAGIELLICDEAHRVSGGSFFKIAAACSRASYRVGLTATPHMKDSREDNLRLTAICGDMACSISNSDLIQRGILAEPHLRFVQTPMPPSIGRTTKYDRAYEIGIVKNPVRNALVIREAKRLVRDLGQKVVVLVAREDHGQRLLEIASATGLKATWVSGKTGKASQKAVVRRKLLDDLRDGKLDIIIASTIFDEGLDEASIGAIVLAGGGKSKVSLYQRIGRASRRKKDGINRCYIIDFLDKGNNFLWTHSARRFNTAKDEDGWVIDEVVPFLPDHYIPLLDDKLISIEELQPFIKKGR
jgi:superfamily II DNA or RNA helicase